MNNTWYVTHSFMKVFIYMFMTVEDNTFGLIKKWSCLLYNCHVIMFGCPHLFIQMYAYEVETFQRDISHFHTVEYRDSRTTMQWNVEYRGCELTKHPTLCPQGWIMCWLLLIFSKALPAPNFIPLSFQNHMFCVHTSWAPIQYKDVLLAL